MWSRFLKGWCEAFSSWASLSSCLSCWLLILQSASMPFRWWHWCQGLTSHKTHKHWSEESPSFHAPKMKSRTGSEEEWNFGEMPGEKISCCCYPRTNFHAVLLLPGRKFQLEKLDVIPILREYKHLTKDRRYVVTRQLQRLYILGRCRVMHLLNLSQILKIRAGCMCICVCILSIDRSTSDASFMFSPPHLQHREKSKPWFFYFFWTRSWTHPPSSALCLSPHRHLFYIFPPSPRFIRYNKQGFSMWWWIYRAHGERFYYDIYCRNVCSVHLFSSLAFEKLPLFESFIRKF